MAAKLLYSLADENPDLQKQMGCMVGAYQIFDNHHTLATKRLGHGNLQAGNSQLNNGIHEGDSNNAFHRQTATETNINRSGSEKQRISTESSRASFSSSRSSSFSSLEYNKTAQQEVPFPKTPHKEMVMDQPSSPHVGSQCIGLRDVVKESMYREARGLLVQTTAREDISGSMVKHRDSPRPFQLPKSVDGSYGVGINGKQNVSDDLKESLRVLAKLREAPLYYNNEAREPQRSSHEANGSWNLISRDANAPRFSYDGREVNHLSSESRDTFKSAPKLKVLPRHSLDSCERSMRGSSHLTESFHSIGNLDGRVTNPPQSLGPQKRPPNVIAKLMGLESLPSSFSAGDGQLGVSKTCSVEDNYPFLRSLRANDPSRPTRTNSIRSSLKDPASPQWKNPDLIMKPISSSRFPIEPAPWKHVGGSQGSQKHPLKHVKVPVNNPNTFPSVYSEIGNKLKDLEFKQSGKDLRALKQIIEAMQAKGLLETQKEEQAENLATQRDYEPKCTSLSQNPRGHQSPLNTLINTSPKIGSESNRTYECPIVIMKPAKLLEKVGIHASKVIPIDEFSSFPKVQSGGPVDNKKGSTNGRAARDCTARNSRSGSAFSSKRVSSRNIKAIQFSMKSPKESTATSVKNSGQASPRLQPKKLESDRRSRPPTVPPDPSKPRRQCHWHLSESGTSGGKHRPKSPDMQQCGDQLSQISTKSRTSSHQGGDISLQSEISIILQSKLDVEEPSHERSVRIIASQSPSVKAPKCSISSIMPKKSHLRIVEDELIQEPAVVAPEHPSPVSVLYTSFYRDYEPSPVKQISNTSEGNGAEGLNKDQNDEQCNPADKCTANNVGSGLTSEINRKKLKNIEHLVQKLRRLNSEHDEASTDYIASLCGNTNPDHRYISEILLASGLLLKDLGSGLTTFQLHPSGHPINPELFLVLEQTISSSLVLKEESDTGNVSHSKPDHEKFHRKLIFDSVNEILVGKLALFGAFPEPTIILGKLAKKSLTAHQLLKELCFEIEQLESRKAKCELEGNEDGLKSILCEEVMSRSENWTDLNGEISGMVLDVERLVFKDLVNEIVIGEEGSLRAKQSRRRRRLFSK
ncbi:hypothetical protein F3Y22_tig00111073pilonHSYRG00040 [Hibiscus syriacus]|uniref:DUF4378 domain-containing protein n=1 Tax=Hibiscus syriacus TaxID=106335 RepID=A0A6A2Z2V7_HIBSY|nr:protein LONGIFOLIA 2-like isoform X2 [Hibiscus syriacus]KAE8686208.1 hypothetical protein F3Y22_tig00111073pilonHSYRG00040 [Hibiscus syriacus]